MTTEITETIFSTPILQSFLVKTNLLINLPNVIKFLPLSDLAMSPSPTQSYDSFRSGTIIALKYNTTRKGRSDLFKTQNGFKNACHLIMCHTFNKNKRKKKLIQIKITSVGTFQVVGIPAVDVEKVVYKLFLALEKANQNNRLYTTKTHNRLEIVIIPILNNYMLTLSTDITKKIFEQPKVQIVKKFVDSKFLSFTVPKDHAITIKKSFTYNDYKNHEMKYITWNKKYGKIVQFIKYDLYTTLLSKNVQSITKYTTLRLYSTGKVLVSGFDDILINDSVQSFLDVCNNS